MRKTIVTLFLVTMMAVTAHAQNNSLLLKPRPRDFFQEVKYMEPVPGIETSLKWSRPPAMKVAAKKMISPYLLPLPQVEEPVMLNSFEVMSNAVLTENDLGGGTMLTIKTSGAGDTFTYIADPQTVVDLKYHQYDVKTSGPGVNEVSDFSIKQIGVRRVQSVPFIENYIKGADLLGELRYISDKVDSAYYLSGTANKPFNEKLTGTFGAEYIDSGTGGRATGVVAGARYELTPQLQAFAIYSGADPLKFVYNYHMLQAVSSVGSIYCVDCDQEALNAGITYKMGSNFALNVFGFDLLDVAAMGGSLSYVVKE